ncbi:GDSL esterase/lipase 5 [Cucumis melo var. makuwa]|uniref:GDSL esterase/lipase 5 n=2 Tax=Cucumis melo TaxID=3656 RepID=A0A5D3D6J2_CUCMM|nr:GDSL esterase/lipase 5 [Cucumis melo var. makuwa]TYK19142.1 GDSL esterase/lipase 5 [Cucumis melo var. makuwa]
MATQSTSHGQLVVLCATFFIFSSIRWFIEVESYSLPENHAAFFIFGDSFLDAGNNNYINTTTLDQANFWPYGQTHFRFPTGRFSDGRLVSDFIAEFAKLPLISPFLQPGFHQYHYGVNFASAGAGALSETFHGSVIELKAQIKYFKEDVETWLKRKLGKAEGGLVLSKAVYLFGIGTNDYMSLFLTNSPFLKSHSKSQYVDLVIGNLTTSIKQVYDSGGRKFGFMNLPPMGCSPGLRGERGECLEELAEYANVHNQRLVKVLEDLEKQLKGFKYSLYDFSSSLRQRMENPLKYGLKEGKEACCGTGRFRGVFSCGGRRGVKEFEVCRNPNEHVFWDSYHLTENLHKQLADELWSGSSNSHSSLRDLFQTVCG